MKRLDKTIIVAVDENGGYAFNKTIPWSFKQDWDHFKSVTSNSICVMGRKTYEDIVARRNTPEFEHILPNRTSYVVSKSLTQVQGAVVIPNFTHVPPTDKPIFLLGGFRLWMDAWNHVREIYLTLVPGEYETNKRFPVHLITRDFYIGEGRKEETDEGTIYFVRYIRKGIKDWTRRWNYEIERYYGEEGRN